jgi:hypothetical protein
MKYKRSTRIIVYIALAALILAGVYFAFPNKSAQRSYLEAEAKNFLRFSNDLKHTYDNFIKSRQPYINKNHSSRTVISIDPGGGAEELLGGTVQSGVIDIAKNLNLVFDMNFSADSVEGAGNASLMLQDLQLVRADIFFSEDLQGISLPKLVPDTYFIRHMPMFTQQSKVADSIRFNQGEFNKTMGEYGKLFLSAINSEEVSIEIEAAVDTDTEDETDTGERETQGKEVVLKIGPEKTRELIDSIRQKLASRDILYEAIFGNYTRLAGLFGESGIVKIASLLGEDELEIEDIAANMDEKIRNFLEEEAGLYDFYDGLMMSVRIDDSGNILERELNISFKYKSDEYELNINIQKNDIQGNTIGNCMYRFSLTAPGSGSEIKKIVITIDSHMVEIWEDGINVNGSIKAALERYEENMIREHATANIIIKQSYDESNNSQTSNILLGFKVYDGNNTTDTNETSGVPVTLYINSTETFDTGSPQLPDMSGHKTVDLDKVSESEFHKIMEEAQKNAALLLLYVVSSAASP